VVVVVVVVQSVGYACSTHVYGSSSSTQDELLLYNPERPLHHDSWWISAFQCDLIRELLVADKPVQLEKSRVKV